uniref:PH domain-containing protein n=1 Tax=Plectus sambesii TaxID=2011161 RepID=A0A914VD49_9BILA
MAETASSNWNPNNAIKSGWLLRQSKYLKRWKRAWFVLYSSGRLSYYESDHASSAKDHLHIPAERAEILTADRCEVEAPEGYTQKSLIGLRTKSKTWYLCAENDDDLMAWTLSLEDAQALQPTSYGQQQGWAPGTIPDGMRAVYPDQVKAAMNFGVYDPSQVSVVQGDGAAIKLPPGSTMYLTHEGPVIIDAQGHRTLILQNGHHGGMGVGGGMLAGAAFGSMMMWPWLLWTPCFWW